MTHEYPFQPKSTVRMKVGQFWPIALKNGSYACGRVIGFEEKDGKRKRVSFLAGLMDWTDQAEPTGSAIADRKILAQRLVHISTITKHYGLITGFRDMDHDGIEPLLWVEHRSESEWSLYKGTEFIKILGKKEADQYPRRKTGGFNVMNILANKEFNTQPGSSYNSGQALRA